MKTDKIRVLVAKAGCDIHERGALTLSSVLRDAGMEVIYTGRYQIEEAIARAAVAEDVDIVALSDLSGSMPIIARKILEALKSLDADDIKVLAGGLMTPEDEDELKKMGVAATFPIGSSIPSIIECIKEIVG